MPSPVLLVGEGLEVDDLGDDGSVLCPGTSAGAALGLAVRLVHQEYATNNAPIAPAPAPLPTAPPRWYEQAGTPLLSATGTHNPSAATYTLRFVQSTPPTPGQPTKLPVPIPVRMGLLGPDGSELPLTLRGGAGLGTETVLRVTEAEQEFVFEHVPVSGEGEGAGPGRPWVSARGRLDPCSA